VEKLLSPVNIVSSDLCKPQIKPIYPDLLKYLNNLKSNYLILYKIFFSYITFIESKNLNQIKMGLKLRKLIYNKLTLSACLS